MNSIYQVIFNHSTGLWTAVSELARGNTKNCKNQTLRNTATLIAFTLVTSGGAFAGTCTSISGPVSGASCNTTGDTTFDITNAQSTGQFVMGITGGKATFTMSDSTANITNGFGVTVTGDGANVKFSGDNTINLSGANTAILVKSNIGQNKGVDVEISGTFNLTNSSTTGSDSFELDGVELSNSSNGDANLIINASGTVETVSGNALFVKNYGTLGSILISVSGGPIALKTTGNGASGIFAMNAVGNTQGNLIIESTANIETTGLLAITGNANLGPLYANGIAALINNSDNTGIMRVLNKGNIKTAGEFASGIRAVSIGKGTVDVFNQGDITTTGKLAHGIHALTANTDAFIDNQVRITAFGEDASGIRADKTPDSTSGSITVTTGSNSFIETHNVKADGIHATIGSETLGSTAASSGSVTVRAGGSIITHGNGTAEGIYAAITKGNDSSGDVDVTFYGNTIETTGTGVNRGIYARQDGTGKTTAKHLGTLIKTAGMGAHGIHVLNQSTNATGAVDVESTGAITTQGNGAHGIFVVNNTGGGKTTVTNSGQINVAGGESSAIKVSNYGAGDAVVTHKLGASITSTGNNLADSGNIRTDGINVFKGPSAMNDAIIYVYGDITTQGANRSGGAYAANQGLGNATVIGSGNITAAATNKLGAGGIELPSFYSYGIGALVSDNAASTGNALIEYSNGTISTAGTHGYGLYAGLYATKTGKAQVTNTAGIITTSGENSYGIWSRDETIDGGLASVKNTGAISTSGGLASAIYVNTLRGAIDITNDATLATTGNNARGIYAKAANNTDDNIGNISIKSTLIGNQSITTTGGSGQAIRAEIANNSKPSGGISITHSGGKFITQGTDGHGVYATTNASSGDINVTISDTIMDLKGYNSDGIDVQRLGPTTASNLNINVTTNGGAITLVDPLVASKGGSNFGIIAYQYGAASGDINITNNGTTITTRAANNVSDHSRPIEASFQTNTATGNINIINSGALGSLGANAMGIRAVNNGSGTISITNSGAITTTGTGAAGMVATAAKAGAIVIDNQGPGKILTTGNGAHGIYATSTDPTGGDITVTSNGTITTLDARGIFLQNNFGDANVTASGNITTNQTTANSHNHGIDAGTLHGNANVTFDHGTIDVTGTNISGNAIGIAAWDRGSAANDVSASITLGSNAIVDASKGVSALQIRANNSGRITIAAGAKVHGGSESAIDLLATGTSAVNHTLDNHGIIDAKSDLAIRASNSTAATATVSINNSGTITGYSKLMGAAVTFNNQVGGLLSLRNFGSGTKELIHSSFGGNGLFNNAGTIELNKQNYNGVATHALMSGIKTFTHSGTITLSDALSPAYAGDILGISGTFVTNGGAVIFDTVLDDARSNGGIGHSDQLHLANTQMGSGATQLFINPMAASQGAPTINNGIQVIKIADHSAANVFTLGHDVLAGAYSYQLQQTGNDWYLTSVAPTPTNPWPGIGMGLLPWNPTNPNIGTNTPTYRPDAGINLANRQSVVEMMVPGLAGSGAAPNGISGSGAMRASVRLGNGMSLTEGTTLGQKSNSLWSFATANDSKGRAANGQISYSAESYSLQIGGDRSFSVGNGLIQAGIMAHMSTVKTKSLNRLTGARATGDSDGYGLGAYATWFLRADDLLSPFIDSYAQFGRYSNNVKTRNNASYKYHANAFSFTLQGGYPIAVTHNIILEPQAQLTYIHYKSNSYKDHAGTSINLKTKGNMIGRVGAYVYGHGYKIQPYGALNLWYDQTQSEMRYNHNSSKVGSDKRGAIVEAKLGFQTQATPNLTLWGEVSARKGRNSYRDVGAAVGIKYTW